MPVESTDNTDKEGLETLLLGKDIQTLVNQEKSTSEVYVIDYNEKEEIKINTSDLKVSEDESEIYVDFQYNGNEYRLIVDSSNYISKSLEVMTLERYFVGVDITTLINIYKGDGVAFVFDYFGEEIKSYFIEAETNDDETELYLYFNYEGIRYKLTVSTDDYITKKLEAISTASELKVEGAEVTGTEKTGWTIRFSDTGNRYTLTSDGTLSEPEKTIDLVEGSLAKAYVDGELKIGDTVAYTPESGKSITIGKDEMGSNADKTISTNQATNSQSSLKWQVLDVNDATGVVTLVSNTSLRCTSSTSDYIISGKVGYLNGTDTLHKMCSIFGTGDGATSARSLTLDDIIKVFKLEKTTIEDPNNGQNNDPVRNRIYGDQLTYYANKTTWNPTNAYSFADGRTEYARTSTFTDINGNAATDEKTITLTDTACYLNYNRIFTVSADIKKMIFGSNYSCSSLLATTGINAELDGAGWNIHYISGLAVNSVQLYYSNGTETKLEQSTNNYQYTSIRPVVTLEANILGEKDANGVWQLK